MSAIDSEKRKTKIKINFYSVLGVSKAATDLELKNAYEEKKRGLKSQSGSEEGNEENNPKWALISEAYRTLSDPKKREKFDEELKFILTEEHSATSGNSFSKLNEQLKRFGRLFRFTLLFILVLLLVLTITYLTSKEIGNPSTRIRGIKVGLLLYSLMSFFLLLISYYKDLPSRIRAWFRVISICILAFCFTVTIGLFAVPTIFNF